MTYALLKDPNHTRVSYQSSNTLAINELTLTVAFAENIRLLQIGGVTYIAFDSTQPITQIECRQLSRLSFVYAIFECHGDMLKPVALTAQYMIDSELSGILKYTGKTNALFTRLMLNIASLYVKNAPQQLNVLDPLAGKGTSLYEALMQGHHAYGVEIDGKVAHESVVYLKKYLETAKYKHETHAERTSGQSQFGKFTAQRNQIKIKTPAPCHFEMVAGDARNTGDYFKKNFFHIIVADLPYGVQHGSKANKAAATSRNAFGLIADAMPGWVRVLKPGGAIVLAWNLFLIPRHEMERLLAQNGFAVQDLGMDFAHKVDQAIDRDFIVGVLK